MKLASPYITAKQLDEMLRQLQRREKSGGGKTEMETHPKRRG